MTLRLPPIGVWTQHLEYAPAARAQELAAELEELGYGALWIPDAAGRDVFTHLALLLSATTRLVGATGVANIWARDAVAMTGAVNTLTEAFPERMLLGMGVSHQRLVEEVRGHVYDKPLAAMRTYLDAMDAAPYASQPPATPVRRVLGALGPQMLKLGAERADGVHPYFTTAEHTAAARAAIGPQALLCPEQAVVVERDAERARSIGRNHTARYVLMPNYVNNLRRLGFIESDFDHGGSDRLVDAIVAWGTVEQISERVQSHFDAGADHVCIQALSGGRALPDDQWRQLAPALLELAAARPAQVGPVAGD